MININISQLNSSDADFSRQLDTFIALLDDPAEELVRTVSNILGEIKQRKDEALLEYTNKFDNRKAGLDELKVSADNIRQAVGQIPAALREALQAASVRIRSYHEHQKLASWSYEDEDGTLLGQQVTAMDRVGVYVPGGKADYPSSVLMNVIPAQVAGVREIVMVVPAPGGELNPVVLAAASIAGLDTIYSIGGAQAIGALAYGTGMIPAVDKIVGPGGRFVAEAKRQVFGRVGIDMIAGPSEVVIVTDGSCNPDWLAMDLFAQAEHDEDARAILISTGEDCTAAVTDSINKLLPDMERSEIIRRSLEKNGRFIKVNGLQEAAQVVNRIAPEHLELSVADPQLMLPEIRHAGAVFLGMYSAEALGDYCAGPNHVLPTARSARYSSPLGVYDFQKRSSILMCTANSASGMADIAAVLARGEGLTAHARAAEYRLKR
jgi:histidinol dehydrogenase